MGGFVDQADQAPKSVIVARLSRARRGPALLTSPPDFPATTSLRHPSSEQRIHEWPACIDTSRCH